ncbi:MAG: hypothetical protein AAFR35_04535 [Pseudomonadota bacterium]
MTRTIALAAFAALTLTAAAANAGSVLGSARACYAHVASTCQTYDQRPGACTTAGQEACDTLISASPRQLARLLGHRGPAIRLGATHDVRFDTVQRRFFLVAFDGQEGGVARRTKPGIEILPPNTPSKPGPGITEGTPTGTLSGPDPKTFDTDIEDESESAGPLDGPDPEPVEKDINDAAKSEGGFAFN